MENFFSNKSANGLATVNSTTLKATDFFTDNNPDGYFSKAAFKTYAEELIRNERRDFAGFINELKNGVKLNWNLTIRKDRSNRDYIFPQFLYARATKGYKVIMNDDIRRFIEDYAVGTISIDFTADDLAKVAFNG